MKNVRISYITTRCFNSWPFLITQPLKGSRELTIPKKAGGYKELPERVVVFGHFLLLYIQFLSLLGKSLFRLQRSESWLYIYIHHVSSGAHFEDAIICRSSKRLPSPRVGGQLLTQSRKLKVRGLRPWIVPLPPYKLVRIVFLETNQMSPLQMYYNYPPWN